VLTTIEVVCVWLPNEFAFRKQLAIKVGLQSVLLVHAVFCSMLYITAAANISALQQCNTTVSNVLSSQDSGRWAHVMRVICGTTHAPTVWPIGQYNA
jgi:hypothetical protein